MWHPWYGLHFALKLCLAILSAFEDLLCRSPRVGIFSHPVAGHDKTTRSRIWTTLQVYNIRNVMSQLVSLKIGT
jgi:hypothetical protein